MSDILQKLRTKHPDYIANKPVWDDISLLLKGAVGTDKMAHKFIKRRLSESIEEYRDRMSRVTYSPVLPDCIRDLVKKFLTGSLLVESPGYGDWDDGRFNWLQLMGDVITDSTLYGRAVIIITDKGPKTINPLQLTNYREGLWAVLTDSYYESDGPLSDYKLVTRYTVITSESTRIVLSVDDKVVSDTEERHGFNALPLMLLVAPAELYTGAMALRKAIQHFTIDNVIYEASNNLYIQRYMSQQLAPDNDLGDTYELTSDNKHIVLGSFGFSEAGGSSIKTGLEILDSIAREIRDIISLGGLGEGGNSNQSGLSRRYDYQSYSLTVQNLGAYAKKCLGKMGAWLSEITGVSGDFEFAGLDIFELSNLEYVLGIAERIVPIEPQLQAEAVAQWYARVDAMLGRL